MKTLSSILSIGLLAFAFSGACADKGESPSSSNKVIDTPMEGLEPGLVDAFTDDVSKRLERVQVRASELQADADARMNSALASLEAKRANLAIRLETLNQETRETFADAKGRTLQAIERLEADIERLAGPQDDDNEPHAPVPDNVAPTHATPHHEPHNPPATAE